MHLIYIIGLVLPQFTIYPLTLQYWSGEKAIQNNLDTR